MADVAQHVGVSRALVSIVFRGVDGASEATRQRVLEAAAELGYRPDSLAQGLRRSRTPQPGRAVLPAQAVRGRAGRAHVPGGREAGLPPAAGRVHPRPRPGRRGRRAAAATAARGSSSSAPSCTAATSNRSLEEVAVVEVGRGVTTGPVDVVRNDDAVGTRQAVDHLVGLGHRAIAYIDGGDNPGAERPERGLPRGDGRPRPGRRDPGGRRRLHRGRGRARRPVAAGRRAPDGRDRRERPVRHRRPRHRAPGRRPGAGRPVGRRLRRLTLRRGCPGSTSPRSGRTSRRWPGWRSRLPSNAWSGPRASPRTWSCGRSSWCGAPRRRRVRRVRERRLGRRVDRVAPTQQRRRPMSPGAGPGHHVHDDREDRSEVRQPLRQHPGMGRDRPPAHRRAALLDHHGPGGRAAARGAARGRLARRRVRVLHRGRGAEAAQPRREPARRGDDRQHRCARLAGRQGRRRRGHGGARDRPRVPAGAGRRVVREVRRRLAVRRPRRRVRRAERLRRQHRGRRAGLPGRGDEGHGVRRRPRPDDVPLLRRPRAQARPTASHIGAADDR